MSYQYPPIDNESVFENFITDLFNSIHETSSFQLYKTKGAKQHGIDAFSTEKKIVIQCKKKDLSRVQKELENELVEDFITSLELVKNLPFTFNTFVLASTTKKFSKVQDMAVELAGNNDFDVEFWSWTDIQRHIHNYPKIQERYYPAFSPKTSTPATRKSCSQKVVNSGVIYGGCNQIINTNLSPTIKILPPQGTIGANLLLKKKIQDLFTKLGDERAKRFGKESAYSVMNRNFNKSFDIESRAEIWRWPESSAALIVQYLEEKYANTIAGRKEMASKKADYIPTRPQLYNREKELLSHLGQKIASPEIDEELQRHFGVTSHKDLTLQQHWFWVCHLEDTVKKIVDNS